MPATYSRERNPNWGGSAIGYTGAHMRVRRERGPASAQTCPCGAPAQEWSYVGGDPDERMGTSAGFPVVFGVNPEFYTAVCRSCHRARDARLSAACKHGHPFTEDNTSIVLHPSGRTSRRCRACHRESERQRRLRGSA